MRWWSQFRHSHLGFDFLWLSQSVFSGVFIWNLLSLVAALIGMFGSIFVYTTHKQDYILKMQALFTRLDFGFVHPELKKSTIT